jgi:hypothetical protein
MTAGACRDLDSPGDTTTCGTGSCARTVQRCLGGMPNACTPGSPVVETCNGMDDDCDGTPDDGSGASLCPAAPNAANYACSSATCSLMCQSTWYDVDGTYSNGCECHDTDSGSTSCTTATGIGTVGSAMTLSGTLVTTVEGADWFSVNFPIVSRGPTLNGTPRIAVSSGTVVLDVYIGSCSESASCGTEGGTASGTVTYSFTDDQSSPGAEQWSMNLTQWPRTAIFAVRPAPGASGCIPYTITLSR